MKKTILFIFATVLLIPMFGQESISPDVKKRLLDRHNMYRAVQGAPDLVWDDDLADKAQEWADVIAKKDVLMHSSFEYGENIYVATYTPSPEEVVDLWADEQKFYNGEKITNSNFSLVGHYTQIIWSSTTKVGCAEAISKKGNHYWVCEYDPAGNYQGEKPVENYKKKKK